uniref:RRM domain-containing protein n=1 Tax=Ditylenchus dipsaci TaxID=166011 RepID=A0A915DXQ4_9BILA
MSSFGIVVDNLSNTVSENELKEEFSMYGPVKKINMQRKGSDCMATIEFDSDKARQSAIHCMNNQELKGRLMHIHPSK